MYKSFGVYNIIALDWYVLLIINVSRSINNINSLYARIRHPRAIQLVLWTFINNSIHLMFVYYLPIYRKCITFNEWLMRKLNWCMTILFKCLWGMHSVYFVRKVILNGKVIRINMSKWLSFLIRSDDIVML